MSEFDFKHSKTYYRGDAAITPLELLAELIDSEWKHSWHWNKESDYRDLLAQIRTSLKSEKDSALARLEELKRAESILSKFEKETL